MKKLWIGLAGILVGLLLTGTLFALSTAAKPARCHEMEDEFCTIIVGCGDVPNMETCKMRLRGVCEKLQSSPQEIANCTEALKKMTCDDIVSPDPCLELK